MPSLGAYPSYFIHLWFTDSLRLTAYRHYHPDMMAALVLNYTETVVSSYLILQACLHLRFPQLIG
jgi:hypothetical protein